MAVAMLFLNWRAFRADAQTAGHDRNQMLRMAAIWVIIISGVTLVISVLHG
jgi:hypothetical protein